MLEPRLLAPKKSQLFPRASFLSWWIFIWDAVPARFPLINYFLCELFKVSLNYILILQKKKSIHIDYLISANWGRELFRWHTSVCTWWLGLGETFHTSPSSCHLGFISFNVTEYFYFWMMWYVLYICTLTFDKDYTFFNQ